ncbi:hypothetical protein DPV78_002067 [Talaromyces pinophilus]|jgi:hypothetical protein|nr:hypothetical protein DPV78_002067 [Talaromyces pinophilus]
MSELDWFSRIIAQASQNPKARISTEELLDIGREYFGDETVEELQRSWPQREALTQEASTLGDYSSTIAKLQLQYQSPRKKGFTLPDGPNVNLVS